MTIWTARYDLGNLNNYFSDMVKDRFGNIYVAGFGYPGFDYTTVKYDSSGHKLWEASYNNFGSLSDFATAIAIDSSQNVYVTGYCTNQYILFEYVTVKYDKSGVQQWATKYTSYYNNAKALSVAVDKNNSAYVTGYIDYPVPKNEEFLTVKYDSLGHEVWAREFGTALYRTDMPRKIHIDSSGSVLIDGSSIVKYDSSGILLWADSSGHGYGALDKANNFYLTTSSDDTIHYNWIRTTKYKPNGYKDWIIWWNNGYLGPYPEEILVDVNNNIYIRANANDSNDIVLLKYSQLIGILGIGGELPDKFKLYQNHPNPFNPHTVINYMLPVSGNINIKVYDITGREIITLVNQKQNAGTYKIVFDGNGYSSGVYFYTLKIDEKIIDSKKMVLKK